MATYGGQNVGAKKMDRISKGLKACSMLGIGYAILAFVILALTGRNLALFFVERAEVEVIGNVYLFLLINSAFYIPLAFVNIVRFLIQGMGYSKFAILAGVCEMAARTLVGFALVPLFGFPAACFASRSHGSSRTHFVPGVPACVPEDGKDAEREHTIVVLPEQNVSTI